MLVTLGSNIEPAKNYANALARIAEQLDLKLVQSSPIYESVAVGPDGEPLDQQPYHNGAIWLETALSIDVLRSVLRGVEAGLGREREENRFAARTIDIDIAFYGDAVAKTDQYTIPDPDVVRFAHIAQPLADIAPDWIHPTQNKTLRQIAASLDQTHIKKLIYQKGVSGMSNIEIQKP